MVCEVFFFGGGGGFELMRQLEDYTDHVLCDNSKFLGRSDVLSPHARLTVQGAEQAEAQGLQSGTTDCILP